MRPYYALLVLALVVPLALAPAAVGSEAARAPTAQAGQLWLLVLEPTAAFAPGTDEPAWVAQPGEWYSVILEEEGWALAVWELDPPENVVWIQVNGRVELTWVTTPALTRPIPSPQPLPQPTVTPSPTAVPPPTAVPTPTPSPPPPPRLQFNISGVELTDFSTGWAIIQDSGREIVLPYILFRATNRTGGRLEWHDRRLLYSAEFLDVQHGKSWGFMPSMAFSRDVPLTGLRDGFHADFQILSAFGVAPGITESQLPQLSAEFLQGNIVVKTRLLTTLSIARSFTGVPV